jgi:hypothetical protein
MYDINDTTFNSWIKRFRRSEEETTKTSAGKITTGV